MEKLNLQQVADYCKGKVYGDPLLEVTGVQIDSRKVKTGDLFVALKGEQTDGHLFVFGHRGTASVVEYAWAEKNQALLPKGQALIAVADPQQGLQLLAARYRNNFNIQVVGVTGSSGKTTTKDMIAAVAAQGFNVHKTEGNFNNELGLPLTLLGLDNSHQAAVLEMGMRGLGEISFLCSLARPTIGVITNIGATHMELLGSQENIAQAKGELPKALPDSGTAVLNGDDPWCCRLGNELSCKVIYYALDNPRAELTALKIKPWGGFGTRFLARYQGRDAEVFLPLPGRHNVANALAAIGTGLSLGMDLRTCAGGLKNLQLTGMRMEICQGPRQTTIINDTYNANPGSTKAALAVLAESGAGLPKVAVLGSMFELGLEAEKGHKEVGACAAGIKGMNLLVTVGELGEDIARGALAAGMDRKKVVSFATTQEASAFLGSNLPEEAWVLVKGSRGMQMELIVKGLLKDS